MPSGRCDDCGHDYLVAYSCKGRGVCPSCNTRRMVETAALHIGAIAFIRSFSYMQFQDGLKFEDR